MFRGIIIPIIRRTDYVNNPYPLLQLAINPSHLPSWPCQSYTIFQTVHIARVPTLHDCSQHKVCTFRYLPPITHTTCTQTYLGIPDTCTPLSEHTPRYSLPHRPADYNNTTFPHILSATPPPQSLDHKTITDSPPTNTKLYAFTRTLPDKITAH